MQSALGNSAVCIVISIGTLQPCIELALRNACKWTGEAFQRVVFHVDGSFDPNKGAGWAVAAFGFDCESCYIVGVWADRFHECGLGRYHGHESVNASSWKVSVKLSAFTTPPVRRMPRSGLQRHIAKRILSKPVMACASVPTDWACASACGMCTAITVIPLTNWWIVLPSEQSLSWFALWAWFLEADAVRDGRIA